MGFSSGNNSFFFFDFYLINLSFVFVRRHDDDQIKAAKSARIKKKSRWFAKIMVQKKMMENE